MKRIGIVGGLGPEATVDYYQEIINAFKGKEKDLLYPEIIIYSVNMSEFLELMRNKDYDKVVSLLLEKINALASAGAEFAAMTANTPHLLFDRLNKKSPLPLISIVEAASKEALSKGIKQPGLFGTGFTMNATFYQDVFHRQGIEIKMPEPADKELINHKLFSEIELGIFRDDTRQMLIGIIEKMVVQQQIDAIILGCTELPIILKDNTYAGIPVIDTTRIHVKEIVDYCIGEVI